MRQLCNQRQCGKLTDGGRYCEEHAPLAAQRRYQNKKANPAEQARQRIYKSAMWQKTKRLVKERDEYTCVECGATEVDSVLVVDHVRGVLNVDDPYDLSECQTLCIVCSGRKDGARAAGAARSA